MSMIDGEILLLLQACEALAGRLVDEHEAGADYDEVARLARTIIATRCRLLRAAAPDHPPRAAAPAHPARAQRRPDAPLVLVA
jgi:hypothetical protein